MPNHIAARILIAVSIFALPSGAEGFFAKQASAVKEQQYEENGERIQRLIPDEPIPSKQPAFELPSGAFVA